MTVSLRALSDHDVLSRTLELTRRERSLTLSVLLHLNEIERRLLHLKQGYASMFEYCTAGLGYSASAAMRRIRTARCVERYPQVQSLLESNDVNMSTVAQVSRILTVDNVDAVFARIRGRSQREVEAIVASFEPRASLPPDRVRTVVMRVPMPAAPADPAPATPEAQGKACDPAVPTAPVDGGEPEVYNRYGCDRVESPGGSAMQAVEMVAELEVRHAVIQFTADEALLAKVEKVRALAWHRLPAGATFAQVFELALDVFIATSDPVVRKQKRDQRHDAHRAPRGEGMKDAAAANRGTRRRGRPPIPAHVRDEVFVRDRGRCAYVGPGGRRCGSTHALQVDHVTPVARGGGATPGNLRLLCAQHNRLEAERIMGIMCPAEGRTPVGRGGSLAARRRTPPPRD